MADKFGSNYTKSYVSVPSERPNPGDFGGLMRVELDFSLAALTAADVFYFGKLPKGARVLSINSIGAGTSPVFNVAPGDITTGETIVSVVIGATPGVSTIAWVEYALV